MNQSDFYLQHSPMSHPGAHAYLFDAVDDVASICKAAQNVLVHYSADKYKPPKHRYPEADLRFARHMLARILYWDERPLTKKRMNKKRLVGCCRDYALLAVSMMRHKGIPARLRYGTASYFKQGYYIDHVVVEYWHDSEKRWVMIDAEYYGVEHFGFDTTDMPKGQFILGADGWLMARQGKIDINRFGLGSRSRLNGWRFILPEMMLDLAALNRVEMLCWDKWGFAINFKKLKKADKEFLDKVAYATTTDDNFQEWQTYYQHDKLSVPDTVNSYSPACPPKLLPMKVNIDMSIPPIS